MLANNLKTARLKAGYTRKYMASQIGIANPMYGYYETGRSVPRLDNLVKVAKILHVSLDFLLDNEPNEYNRCIAILEREAIAVEDINENKIKVSVHHTDYTQTMIMTKDDLVQLVHHAEKRNIDEITENFYRIFTDSYSFALHERITNKPISSIKDEPLEYVDIP